MCCTAMQMLHEYCSNARLRKLVLFWYTTLTIFRQWSDWHRNGNCIPVLVKCPFSSVINMYFAVLLHTLCASCSHAELWNSTFCWWTAVTEFWQCTTCDVFVINVHMYYLWIYLPAFIEVLCFDNWQFWYFVISCHLCGRKKSCSSQKF